MSQVSLRIHNDINDVGRNFFFALQANFFREGIFSKDRHLVGIGTEAGTGIL
jgi:hypothetical protein